jgi:hypothetical protein
LSLLPQDELYILHDIRLPFSENFFQIDTLLITPNFIYIVEVKNIAGILFFDPPFKQLIRKNEAKEEGFLDPISQVKRQMHQFKRWLEKHNFSVPPIEHMVAVSKSSTIIKADKEYIRHVQQKVIHAEQLLDKYQSFQQTYLKKVLDSKMIKKICKLILKQHQPENINILSYYQLCQDSILTGVQCPSCYTFPMKKVFSKWICQQCHGSSKDAHIQALDDYFLLLSPTISNSQCCQFLHLPPNFNPYRLLSKLQLSHNGKTKGRVYMSPFE